MSTGTVHLSQVEGPLGPLAPPVGTATGIVEVWQCSRGLEYSTAPIVSSYSSAFRLAGVPGRQPTSNHIPECSRDHVTASSPGKLARTWGVRCLRLAIHECLQATHLDGVPARASLSAVAGRSVIQIFAGWPDPRCSGSRIFIWRQTTSGAVFDPPLLPSWHAGLPRTSSLLPSFHPLTDPNTLFLRRH